NAADLEAYRMEQTIFFKVMQIGLAGMKCYFAEKGTGDVGKELTLEDNLCSCTSEDAFQAGEDFEGGVEEGVGVGLV
ncbi:MAG: hypothetical protein ABIL68_04485, partial [bacterium]